MFLGKINFAFVGRDDPDAPFAKFAHQRRAGVVAPYKY